MKRLAFALALLMLAGSVGVSPARADFAVIKFENGYCQIWWDSANKPGGGAWTKIAAGLLTIRRPGRRSPTRRRRRSVSSRQLSRQGL